MAENEEKIKMAKRKYKMVLSITYIIGSMLGYAIYLIKQRDASFAIKEALQIVLEFLMPSTIAYLLISSISNLADLKYHRKASWTWWLIVYAFGYSIFYIIYELEWNNWCKIIIAGIATLIGIIVDGRSFNENIMQSIAFENEAKTQQSDNCFSGNGK